MRVLSLVVLAGVAFGQSALPPDDPRQIILRSAARDQTDLELAKNYTYISRTSASKVDSSGKLKRADTQTHEVLILYGQPYRRLVAKNDEPLPPDQERKELKKLDQEMEHRRRTSEEEREKLAREEQKKIDDRKAMIREVADAFSFRILGEEKVDGHDAWVIQAKPLPGYRPRSDQAKMLPCFQGTLWITKDEYRWVKIDAEVVRTVSLGWVLIRLQPGTRLFMEQKRVQDEIWLPSAVRVRVVGRLALLLKANVEADITYSNYRKFQSDSRVLETSEVPATPPR